MTEQFADGDPMSGEELGRMVRLAWVRWAEQQPNPKPSWLTPWEQLSDADKQADRQIGAALYGHFLNYDLPRRIAALEAALLAEREKVTRLEEALQRIADFGHAPDCGSARTVPVHECCCYELSEQDIARIALEVKP